MSRSDAFGPAPERCPPWTISNNFGALFQTDALHHLKRGLLSPDMGDYDGGSGYPRRPRSGRNDIPKRSANLPRANSACFFVKSGEAGFGLFSNL